MKQVRKALIMLAAVLLVLQLGGTTVQAAGERAFDLSSLLGMADPKTSDADDLGSLGGLLELFGQLTGKTMKDCTISKIPDQKYTGKAVRPVPVITNNGEKLKRGTDFTLTYRDNVSVGTAKCIITGKGLYSGKRTVSFKIVRSGSQSGNSKTGASSGSAKKNGSGSTKKSSTSTAKKFTVKVSPTTYVYNGNQKKPAVKVTAGGKSVAKSAYTVTYKGNKNVGTATVTVKGKGDYKGYAGEATFKITLKKTVISSASSPEEGTVKAGWKKDGQADGYELWFSTSKTFSSSVKKVKVAGNTKQSLQQTGLTSGKKYYVRIRSYKKVGSTNWYSVWSAAKQVSVK